MDWIISANGKMYNHWDSFKDRGYVDWRQSANFEVGDIIYVYSTRPLSRIEFKCIVEKNNMVFEDITDDREYWMKKDEYYKSQKKLYSRLRLLETIDSDNLTLNKLKENGIKAAPQGPQRLKGDLLKYIEKHFYIYNIEEVLPGEVKEDEDLYEGSVVSVKVNKYERNTTARREAIEYHGSSCVICKFNFADVYGDFAKGFIHVHHVVPLSEVNSEYKVDPKKDLVPVCPNCHAMLHKKKDGKYLSVNQLKKNF